MDAPLFTFHTTPFEHQRTVFEATRDRALYAIFWEQGTGKTKVAVDTAVYLYLTGKIEAVLVVAPTGIHENWDVPGEGIRKHMPPELLKNSARMVWHSNRANHVASKRQFERLLDHKGGLRWLFMGFDTLITKPGYAAAERFLRTYRCAWIMDEAARIKNPTAQRTKAVMKLRPLAPYRRPMTGTPVAQKPFDVYAQVRWMYPDYWKENGFGSFLAFKHHFGVWRKIRVNQGREVEVQAVDAKKKPIYRNLDELAALLRPISSRVMKADVLDLPPKVYTSMFYDLTARQRQIYDKLEDEFLVWYMQNSEPIVEAEEDLAAYEAADSPAEEQRILSTSADLAIVRQLRLQQVALGYLVSDDKQFTMVDKTNPALDLVEEIIEPMTGQAILWGRFRKDIDLIMERLGERATRYDGGTKAEDRVKAVQAFQGGDKQFFVATQSTAGEGLTLTAANTVIYYSNSRKLTERLQSEDRAHRIGQSSSVQYIDILGRNTIAEDILAMLLHGEEVAAAALGDRIKERLQG